MEPIEQSALDEAINRLWVRFLPEMMDRIVVLEAAAAAFTAGTLTFPQQEEASSAAHKLAGVLGTFNLTKGTVLARQLEVLYSQENGPDAEHGAELTALAAELRRMIESRKSS